MTITGKQFDDFWKAEGQYLGVNNAERLKANLIETVDTLGDSCKLDDYVCSLRNGRESTRVIIVKFYDYLKNSGIMIDSVLYEKCFYDYPFERQLEIAKFLHTPHSTKEIQDRFDIEARTVRKDLQELEEGITVLGATIRIEKEKKGRSYFYKSTLHPVFLPLNLTEVYALTVFLDRVVNSCDINANIIRDLTERIKLQLSDYAYERLFPNSEKPKITNQYLNDEELARQRDGIYMYLMKSGQRCRFNWKGKEYIGRICWIDDRYGITLDNGEVLDTKLDEVDFIIEDLDYK